MKRGSAEPGGGMRALARSAMGGFLNPFLYYMVLFKAYALLPAQEAQPLNYTWPLVLSLLAVPLMGEKLRWRSLLALLVSFSGVIVISTRGDVTSFMPANPLGAGLALGSSIVWASFWIINVKDERDPVEKLFLNFFFGTLFISLFLVLDGSRTMGFPPKADLAVLIGSAYVGLFEMSLTFMLWLSALSSSGNTARVSNLIYLSPFLSLVFIRFVVGEQILPSSIVGLFLIISGVILQRRSGGA